VGQIFPLLESDWNAQSLTLEARPHPNPNQPVDRGVGPMSNPAGIQRIIRMGTRAIMPAGIRLKPNLWCREGGTPPHGNQGDHASWDPVETKLVV